VAAQVPPVLSITDATVVEGNAGTTQLAFTLSVNQRLSGTVSGVVSVIGLSGASFRPAIRGQSCGDPGVDFAWPADGPFQMSQAGGTLPSGAYLNGNPDPNAPPTATLTIAVCGDPYSEPDEHLFVRLQNVQGAQCFEGTCDGIGTIRNDGDTTPMPPSTLAVSDPTVSEPITGTRTVSFVVSLGSASPSRVEVDYATVDGTARSTGPGSGPWTCPIIDYLSKTGRLVFQSGEVRKTVTTSVCGGDSTSEGNENFVLRLSNAQGTTIADTSGTATIRNFKPAF
jgi:chitinase